MTALADLRAFAEAALRERGLEPDFGAAALDEARNAEAAAGGDIRDLRALPWFSIDNEDTRDLDQLSVVQPADGGAIRLLVAVADVDAFVHPGGAVDAHAALNTTSVYTAAGTFAMLPEVLSTDRTSLHEGQERLAVVADLQVQADGTVSASTLYRAAVLNHAKLVYGDVARWLDGRGAALPQFAQVRELERQLRLHDEVASALRRRRQERGALHLKSVSARPVLEGDRVVDIRADATNRARDLIADLMIAANGAAAAFLAARRFPSLRRFLQAPRRWDRIEALAAQYGVTLPADPDPIALDRFLCERRQAEPGGFEDLSLKVLKMLGSGEYSAIGPGEAGPAHFGLAVNDYAHSTAPNRRYPDLVTQRLVKAALRGDGPPCELAQLQAIAAHCTKQEDNATAAERKVLKAAAAALLQDRIGETFDAVVTGAAAKGVFVRIARPLVEGRLVRGQERADVGDVLRVRLVAVDAQQGHLDFERA